MGFEQLTDNGTAVGTGENEVNAQTLTVWQCPESLTVLIAQAEVVEHLVCLVGIVIHVQLCKAVIAGVIRRARVRNSVLNHTQPKLTGLVNALAVERV